MSGVFGYHHEVHLRAYLYILRKRRKVLLAVFALFLIAGIVFTVREKVLYRAVSTVLIERENPNVVDFKEVLTYDSSTTDYYQTQYQIFGSQSLARELIEEEQLDRDAYLDYLQEKGLRRYLRFFQYWPGRFQRFFAEPLLEDVFISHMLKVKPVPNTRLVQVSVLHPDPVRSAEITNTLVDLFIQRNLRDRYLISTRATELIARQLVELKEKVTAAERALQDYKERHGLVNIPSIREKDKFLQDAQLELVKTQAEEAKLSKRYLPAHPKRIHISSQIEALKEKIREEEEKSLELSRAAVEYSELEREAESTKQIYQALLTRLEETQSQAQTQASNVLVVDRATPPPRPYTPRPFLNLSVALFLGLLSGVALAFFCEYFDPAIKIPDDIEKALSLDFLGIIPKGNKIRGGAAGGNLFIGPEEHQPAAESFRAIRTALLFRLRYVSGGRVIMVSSPNPEEGKSTVALNLAAAFQQNHLKVLLMDADLRKPRLHKFFKVPEKKGVSDILEGEAKFEEIVHSNITELGFDFLSCGSPSEHSAEILGSQKMKSFLEGLRRTYDITLLDTPPYLPVADVEILSEYMDSMVVVAKYHKTDKRHLRGIRRRFIRAEEKNLGVVINQVSVREKDYYYQQYLYYGYGDGSRRR